MSGIAGFSGNFNEELLYNMSDKIKHRGSDDNISIFFRRDNNSIGLANRLLFSEPIIKKNNQSINRICKRCGLYLPCHCNKQLYLIFDGTIFNYNELRVELELKGHDFQTDSDMELLLHLYCEKGPKMIQLLNGSFAFALYDGRDSGQIDRIKSGDILLARDGIGVKPLYYSEINIGFLFASELKAILSHKEMSLDIDYKALHYYIAYLWAPAPYTMVEKIKKLLPGEAMIVRKGNIYKKWIFYDLPYGQEKFKNDEKEIIFELDKKLKTVIGRQISTKAPFGISLSGGLDSSSILAITKQIYPEYNPKCYSIAFADDVNSKGCNPDDMLYARKVAKYFNVDLCPIIINSDVIQNLEYVLYLLDEPQGDPAPINLFLIAKQVNKEGIKILLSGSGGDDIFSGYRRHRALKMRKMWNWLPDIIKAEIARRASRLHNGQSSNKFMNKTYFRRTIKVLANIQLPLDEQIVSYFLWSGETIRHSLYSEDVAYKLTKIKAAIPLMESLKRIPNEHDPLNRMLYLEGKHFLVDHNLNYADKTCMANGVDVRDPLIDKELIDFATKIPPNLKQNGRIGKYIFKKAMEPYLPNDVIYRPKSGFGAPLRNWLKNELKEKVADTLSINSIKNRGIFNASSVQNLIKLNQEGRIDGGYTIFSLMCIELWFRIFIDNKIKF